MNQERSDLSKRFLGFAAMVIRMVRSLRKDAIDFHIAKQVIRSATSAGANYQEACAAESRADFIHKLQISLKELNETLYWLHLMELISDSSSIRNLPVAIQENKELGAIIGKSIVTAKTSSVRR